MAFTERLKVVIDVVSGNATRGLSDFRSEVAKADTWTGKLKAGTKALGNSFVSMAASPEGAAAAIGAVTAVAIKGAHQFMELAKASNDLAQATGLTIEQASRWIEVGKDYGVSAEALASTIGKLNRTLDPRVAAEYGIALTDSSGKARSANDVFLDVIAAISNTDSAAERARMGTRLLGRGWQQLAPILGKSRSQYEEMLSTIKDGQVITEEEYKKAEKLRMGLDELNDSWDNLTLQIGQAAASGTGVLDFFTRLLQFRDQVIAWSEITGNGFAETHDPIVMTTNFLESLTSITDYFFGDDNKGRIKSTTQLLSTMGSPSAVGGIGELSGAFDELSDNADSTARGMRDVREQFGYLLNEIDERSALRSIMDDFDTLQQKAVDAWTAAAEGEADAEAKARDAAQAVDDLKVSVIEYADEVGGIPPQAVTRILTQIDRGSLDEAKRLIAGLTGMTITYYGRIGGEKGIQPPGRAAGGPVMGGRPYVVGEAGPELFVPGTSGSIIPSGSGVGGMTFNVTVTNPMMSGEQLANELKAYIQRNGSGWLTR